MHSEHELTPYEEMLLNKMQALEQMSLEIVKKLQSVESELSSTTNELDMLRRKAITLQEENQHLREMLQTWRERMQTVLTQLGNLE